jgi:hypothetical protein
MRLHAKQFLGSLALLALSVPVWAAHTDSVAFYSDGSTTIAGTQLKQGDYELKVKDNAKELQVVTEDGKVVAHVSVEWVQLPNKSETTSVVVNDEKIVEVDFGGKTQAIKIPTN